ncbi:MAG: dihydroneopterin aldolase [Hyphomicrobiales bacterium]|nr:dihydroneopterin aldolase [Hyphomicrobiales bacterium]
MLAPDAATARALGPVAPGETLVIERATFAELAALGAVGLVEGEAAPPGARTWRRIAAARSAAFDAPGAARAGFAGVYVETDGASPDVPALAELVAAARPHGLSVAFGGPFEAPDWVRLAALAPDFVGVTPDFDGAAARPRDPHPHAPAGAMDRVFLREHVRAMRVGAYARERGAPQRVRFAVEALTQARDHRDARMGEIASYSLFVDAIERLAARHFDFVETLAEELAAEVLKSRLVASVTVRVEKLDVHEGVVGVEIVRAL